MKSVYSSGFGSSIFLSRVRLYTYMWKLDFKKQSSKTREEREAAIDARFAELQRAIDTRFAELQRAIDASNLEQRELLDATNERIAELQDAMANIDRRISDVRWRIDAVITESRRCALANAEALQELITIQQTE